MSCSFASSGFMLDLASLAFRQAVKKSRFGLYLAALLLDPNCRQYCAYISTCIFASYQVHKQSHSLHTAIARSQLKHNQHHINSPVLDDIRVPPCHLHLDFGFPFFAKRTLRKLYKSQATLGHLIH